LEKVSEAIFEAGAGEVGDYSNCSFSSDGVGTFIPGENSNPFIGNKGVIELVDEKRFEVIVKKQNLNRVIKSMLKAHPYEEVAYDVFRLENKISAQGLGRIGKLSSSTTLMFFAESVKHSLELDHLKVIGDNTKEVKTVAVLGGSGANYWQKAKAKGADVLITGDVGHHSMIDAIEGGMCIIDAGHFGSEKIMITDLSERLSNLVIEKGYSEIDIQISKSNTECFVVL